MKLSVLLKDSFLWIMVNLDYRKCFQLYEKINLVTHLVGSTEMIVCDLLSPRVPFLKCCHFFIIFFTKNIHLIPTHWYTHSFLFLLLKLAHTRIKHLCNPQGKGTLHFFLSCFIQEGWVTEATWWQRGWAMPSEIALVPPNRDFWLRSKGHLPAFKAVSFYQFSTLWPNAPLTSGVSNGLQPWLLNTRHTYLSEQINYNKKCHVLLFNVIVQRNLSQLQYRFSPKAG